MDKINIKELTTVSEEFKAEFSRIENKYDDAVALTENWVPELKERELRLAKSNYSESLAKLKAASIEEVNQAKETIKSQVNALFLSPIPEDALNIIASLESLPTAEVGREEVIGFSRSVQGHPLLKRRIAVLAKKVGIEDPELTYTVRMDAIIADLEDLSQSIISVFDGFGAFEPNGTNDMHIAMREQYVSEAAAALQNSLDKISGN